MKSVWKELHPHVFLQLFHVLAPFEEGVKILREFSTTPNLPATLFDPLFLANYVLTPVNTIVDIIQDIAIMLDGKYNKVSENKLHHKYRIILQYCYTSAYLKIMTRFNKY